MYMGGITNTNMSIPIPEGFTVGKRIDGIVNTMGKSAGLEQNWGYNAIDTTGKECILLYCNPGNYTIIDKDCLSRIRSVNDKQISWFIGKNGYTGCRTIINEKDTVLTLHQYLMNHYGNGKGQSSIDHINRNKLDNRLSNLRITTQSVQNENRDKVSRHKTAKSLPDEIKDIILPKFVVYYKEKVGSDTYREFFTVEGHPIQKLKENGTENEQTKQLSARRWATTKSNKVDIKDKLEQAKSYIAELDKLQNNPLYTIKDIDKPIITLKESTKIIKEGHEQLVNEVIIPKMDIQIKQSSKKELPKQWKVKDIYEYIKNNNENTYKEYCEENNDITKISDWNDKWVTFILQVKNKKSLDKSEKIIRDFVEDLRRIRHNQLCYEKNSKLVEKEERQQWPNTTVARAFLEGNIDTFKKFTEEYSGDNPNDPKWTKRWNSFLETLEKNRGDIDILKKECSKFMAAQRAKKFRRSKQNETSSDNSSET